MISIQDLNRQVVKTEWSEISIPEIEFEVTKQPGLITTIEGIIDRAIEGLEETSKNLKNDPESVLKLTTFLGSLHHLKEVSEPFDFVSFPSGSSSLQPLTPIPFFPLCRYYLIQREIVT